MELESKQSIGAFQELNGYVEETRVLVAASGASICIVRGGKIVNEWYSGSHGHAENSRPIDAKSRFNVASIRKTYLGFAISLAIQEGKIRSINDSIIDYLTDLDESVMGGTTIRHLLTHTHGLQGPGKRLFPPGTDWKYNNAGVNLLIRIVQAVFGQSLAEVLEQRVFDPYGLKESGWCKENGKDLVWLDETYAGGQGGEANLFVSTRELAYWGYLHLAKGNYEGRQLVPGEVFERAVGISTPASLDESLPRNGFFWWVHDRPRPRSEIGGQVPQGSYQSFGLYGNALLVIPELDAVAVRMLNQTGPNPPGYDYIRDVQTFGTLSCRSLKEQAYFLPAKS